VPAFDEKPIQRTQPLFWEHEGNRALREGSWKLVAKGPAGAWELYDISSDRTEMHDMASAEPEKVKDLSAKWEAFARRTNVLPWIWKPQYGGDGK
jgi:arylsulfatase